MVCQMTIFRAFLVAPFCISITMCNGKSTSSSKLLSINNGPWGSFLEREAVVDLLLEGVFNGGMGGSSVKVVVFLFCMCFELRAFALVVKRSSQAT